LRRIGAGFVRGGIGVGISIVCLVLLIHSVDLGQTADMLGTARIEWIGLAGIFVIADIFFRALRWQCLVAPIHKVRLRRLSGYLLVGYLANNVLPARLGELVRSHYLGDREGISRSATLGTVVVERVIDTLVLVGIGAVAILVLNVRGVVVSAILVGVALAALLCVALSVALAAHRLPGANRVATALQRWPRFVGIALRLREGLRVAAMPRTVALAASLSIAAWGCTLLAFLAVGQALGVELTVGEGALLASGTNLATAIPSGPGYLGTFEYAGKTIAIAFGLSAATGLALAVLIHSLTIALTSTGGLLALAVLGWQPRVGAAGSAGEGLKGDRVEARPQTPALHADRDGGNRGGYGAR
jgi:uncharacterized protein (TIRG00374 family)